MRVLDEHTLAFPSYDGNGMYLSLGNLSVNPHVGLLFVDFASPRRLRVNGSASVDADDPLRGTWAGAKAVVRVGVRRAPGERPGAPLVTGRSCSRGAAENAENCRGCAC